jgi:hypothetical protein
LARKKAKLVNPLVKLCVKTTTHKTTMAGVAKFAIIDEYGRHALLDERGRVRSEYEGISHLVDSLEAYARTGHAPGSFLRAVLQNDLFGAVDNADQQNRTILPQIVTFVYRELPATNWGSREKVTSWIATIEGVEP